VVKLEENDGDHIPIKASVQELRKEEVTHGANDCNGCGNESSGKVA
jgi:hypothetical protein